MSTPRIKLDPGLKLIIGYKTGRALLQLLGGLVAFVLILSGREGAIHQYAETIHEHAVSKLATLLSELLVSTFESKHIKVVAAALALDAGVQFVEAYSLFKGWVWGAWLVVVTTSCLVPFEVYALINHASWLRAAVLIINVFIVIWLVRHALIKHRAHRASRAAG